VLVASDALENIVREKNRFRKSICAPERFTALSANEFAPPRCFSRAKGPKTFFAKIARGGAFPLDDLRGSRKINVNACCKNNFYSRW